MSSVFDHTKTTEGDWRITFNPLSWGNVEPEVIVLGFSKGPTQAGALASTPHDEIAYKKGRIYVGKILAHIGLIPHRPPEHLKRLVDKLIADRNGPFHFASLIRCTVERYDHKLSDWRGSGGGMLDKFMATSFGQRVSDNCATHFLSTLPAKTKLIVMFGLGQNLNYVSASMTLFKRIRPGPWKLMNKVAYTDGLITVVHVEHFASQGALIPNWLGENEHDRAQLGHMAQEAVKMSGAQQAVSGDGLASLGRA